MTLEDLMQETNAKVGGIDGKADVIIARLDAMGAPAPAGNNVTPATTDLTPVLDAIAALNSKVDEIKLQVTPA